MTPGVVEKKIVGCGRKRLGKCMSKQLDKSNSKLRKRAMKAAKALGKLQKPEVHGEESSRTQ